MTQQDVEVRATRLAGGEAVMPTPSTGRKAGRAVREIVETLVLAALIFFAVRMVVLNFRVDGASMVPNLHNEQMLLVNRNAYQSIDLNWFANLLPGEDSAEANAFYPFDPPERGDIVVFDPPTISDKPYIKRIIGLEGERITFGEGKVFVNGIELDEEYIDKPTKCLNGEECDVVVPEGSVFVLGDNRNNSSDSRSFGPVPVNRVVGKAWFSYWPPSDIGMVPHYEYADVPEGPMTASTAPQASAPVAVAPATATPADARERRPRAERIKRDQWARRSTGTPAAR